MIPAKELIHLLHKTSKEPESRFLWNRNRLSPSPNMLSLFSEYGCFGIGSTILAIKITTELRYKMGPRLRELAVAARGGQEARSCNLIADLCIYPS